jgi:hypothetical protein
MKSNSTFYWADNRVVTKSHGFKFISSEPLGLIFYAAFVLTKYQCTLHCTSTEQKWTGQICTIIDKTKKGVTITGISILFIDLQTLDWKLGNKKILFKNRLSEKTQQMSSIPYL